MSENPFAAPASAPPAQDRTRYRFFKRPAAGSAALLLTVSVLWVCGQAVRLFGNADQAYVFFAFIGFNPATFTAGLVWTPLTFQFLHRDLPTLGYAALAIYAFGTDVEGRVGRGVLMFLYFLITALATAGLLALLVFLERLPVGEQVGMLPFACALGVLFLFQTGEVRWGPLPVWPFALALMLPALLLPELAPFGWGGLAGGLASRIVQAVREG